jgi:4-amino-4-deoxy-L-arabinose transferase-like glycosyltransferase
MELRTNSAAETEPAPVKKGAATRRSALVAQGIIAALFLAALMLRIWGARFGLPEYVYHPDEHALVERAAAILRTGDYSPHWFNYPSLYIYVQALSYIPYFLISAARGFGNTIPDPAPYGFYFTGRLMTGLLGALTVPLVYLLGARMFERRTGLLSAALVSFNLLHVVHSHYATTDIAVAFLVTLSLLFGRLVLQKREVKYTVVASLFAGLAASTKYPGAVALIAVLVAELLCFRSRPWVTSGQRIGLCVGVFLGGFLLGTPYAILELNTFLSSLASVVGHYSAGQPGFEGFDAVIWYLVQALTSSDGLLAILGLAGIAWAAVKRRPSDLLLLSFAAAYYLFLSVWRVRFERNLIPLIPVLAVLGGRFLVEMVSSVPGRWPLLRRWEVPLLAICTAAIVLLPAMASVEFDRALSRQDHRTTAAEWVNTNLPAGSKVVVEAFSIPLDEDRYQVIQLVRIDSEEPGWYQMEGVDYVIISDGHWRTIFSQPGLYAREIATYQEILGRSVVVQEFPGHVPLLLSHGYPTIPIYHFPDVLILKLR